MSIAINPVFPVIGAKAAAPDLVLHPGTVINARVLKVLDDNTVRIAISSLTINVLSEVDLQPGAVLQLAVSQTPDGLRLAIVGPSDGADVSTVNLTSSDIFQATDISAIASNRPVGDPASPILSPVEALAVTAAAQAAAAKQAGLSPLFANASAAAIFDNLPESLRQAAQQLLAARPDLTSGLSGEDIKSAFQSSGLFLEASLASGSLSRAEQGSIPDLKAALIVFRQTLAAWLDEAAPGNSTAAQQISSSGIQGAEPKAATPPDVAALWGPNIDVEEMYLPKALLPVAEELLSFNGSGQILSSGAQLLSAGARAAAATEGLNVLQDIARVASSGVIETLKTAVNDKNAAGLQSEVGAARIDVPPPPFRGAAPEPQSIVSPSIVPDAAPIAIVRHLVDDADGAIARQTLLQIASLPDRADLPGVRVDSAAPRWNFEIPFATPRGTAVAQFEISRDGGGGNAVGAISRVWRARFSLDVEPVGPVHAFVALSGETTSVRMWAERPETAARLRDNAFQLGQALRQAELEPGDIVIGNGAPPQPAATAPAGHFLDRAT